MSAEVLRRRVAGTLCALIGAALIMAPLAARAAAQGSQATSGAGDSFDITADEVKYRGKDRVTIADGKVLILFRSFRVTGDHAEYDDKVPCVRVKSKGKVRFEDVREKTVLTAGEIVFYLNEEKVDATGGVVMNYQDGRVLASGDSLSYLGKEKKGVVTGNARVEMGRRLFTAGVITVLFEEETVIATGGTRTVIPGEEIKTPGGSS